VTQVWRDILLASGGAFLVVAALVPLARRVALDLDITDHPGSGKIHRTPTPYLGGVAIALAAIAGSSFLPHWQAEAATIMFASMVVGIIGLVDDIRTVRPATRLAVEALGATAVFVVGARVHIFGGALDCLLTVGWLVVLTNAFNLLDNMDGCAAIVATVTATGLAIAAGLQGQFLVGGLAGLIAGGCAGFLLYNWHPAKIFMGDAGSLFLGFLLSTIALKLRFPVSHSASITAVVVIAAPALFDTTLVVISRLHAGRPIYIGGTDHASHRLHRAGLSTPWVSVVVGSATATCVSLGVAMGRGRLNPAAGAAVVASLSVVGLRLLMRHPAYVVNGSQERTHAVVRSRPARTRMFDRQS
jgi:UDP-GlcNAc:undecaprenyl-phosphate GlcNAc-1-phosphate transferase